MSKSWDCQRKLLTLDYSLGRMDNCLKLDGGEGDHLVCQDGCVGRVELVDWEWGNREVKTGVRRRTLEYMEREEVM